MEGLWWRDADFVPPYKEPNGKNCYWSRGNGWVYAALARVMTEIPEKEVHYQAYLEDFKSMSEALVKCQRLDGFWNVSLHCVENFGGKEVTGTALFVYGMAWGVRNGILDAKKYMPVIAKAWNAMVNDCVHKDGFRHVEDYLAGNFTPMDRRIQCRVDDAHRFPYRFSLPRSVVGDGGGPMPFNAVFALFAGYGHGTGGTACIPVHIAASLRQFAAGRFPRQAVEHEFDKHGEGAFSRFVGSLNDIQSVRQIDLPIPKRAEGFNFQMLYVHDPPQISLMFSPAMAESPYRSAIAAIFLSSGVPLSIFAASVR